MLCTSCTQTSSRNTLSPLSLRLRCLVGKCKSSFWKTMKERNQTRRQISYLSLIIDDNLGQNPWESYTFTPRQHSCAPSHYRPWSMSFFFFASDQGWPRQRHFREFANQHWIRGGGSTLGNAFWIRNGIFCKTDLMGHWASLQFRIRIWRERS